MKTNDWQKEHGAARRAIDKALLAECERRIASEENLKAYQDAKIADENKTDEWNPDTAPVHQITEEMRLKIAQAQTQDPSQTEDGLAWLEDELKLIACSFWRPHGPTEEGITWLERQEELKRIANAFGRPI